MSLFSSVQSWNGAIWLLYSDDEDTPVFNYQKRVRITSKNKRFEKVRFIFHSCFLLMCRQFIYLFIFFWKSERRAMRKGFNELFIFILQWWKLIDDMKTALLIQLQTIFTIFLKKICNKNISYISTFFFPDKKTIKACDKHTLQTWYSIVLLEQLLKRSGMQLVFIHQR